jgi:hypothetical protein
MPQPAVLPLEGRAPSVHGGHSLPNGGRMAFGWKELSRSATSSLSPAYRNLRRRDVDDWLASIGLARRHVARDVAGSVGLVAFGLGLGVAAGLLFAPRRGGELRRQLRERWQSAAAERGSSATTHAYQS